MVDIDTEHRRERWMLLPAERALVESKILANQLTFAALLAFIAMQDASLDPKLRSIPR